MVKLFLSCTVIDKATKKPIPNARVTVPAKGFTVYTDVNGHFELKTTINGLTILSVEKNNYKPFSMTLTREANYRPFVVEIETSTPFDIHIESEMCHLGDDNYSTASANAGQFRGRAVGSTFNKTIFIPASVAGKQQYLVFGYSITTAFASPPSVYLNGKKIAEIQINGDNQKIRLPKNLIKYNQNNVITIKSGRNLMQTAYVDYDDFEFMNLSIESALHTHSASVGLR